MTGMKHHLPPLRSLQDDYDRDAAISAAQAADARAADDSVFPSALRPAVSLITPIDFPPTHIATILSSMVEQALRLRAAGLAPTFLINGEVVDLDGLNTLHR